jgi:hypothetical protein
MLKILRFVKRLMLVRIKSGLKTWQVMYVFDKHFLKCEVTTARVSKAGPLGDFVVLHQ